MYLQLSNVVILLSWMKIIDVCTIINTTMTEITEVHILHTKLSVSSDERMRLQIFI